MSILNDRQITKLATNTKSRMISIFSPHINRQEIPVIFGQDRERRMISYGVSSFGYDVRCSKEFKVFTNVHSAVVDPKDFDDRSFVDIVCKRREDMSDPDFDKSEYEPAIIPPNSFALTKSLEYIRVPDDVVVVCIGKSTYARCGIVLNVTPLEPGWEGNITLEISNTTPLPALVYPHEGIAQLLFFEGKRPLKTYPERIGGGKYQGHTDIGLPKV